MDRVEVYGFEDADGTSPSFTTMDPREAREYAQLYGYRCIANIYEFVDSEAVWDFTAAREESGA